MLEKILESTKESLSVAMKISGAPYIYSLRKDILNPKNSNCPIRPYEMIGIALGTASCILQTALYANLASRGYEEILTIPFFTNILSFVYEMGRRNERVKQKESINEDNYNEIQKRVNEIMGDKNLEHIRLDLDAEAPSIEERATDYYWESLEKNNQRM